MNLRRFFNILLCICLLCTFMPVTKASATTDISAVSITVTEPAVGATPSTVASVPDNVSYYIKEVTWGSVKTFQANTAYTVSILIAIKDGVDAQFVMKTGNSAINATVNGNQARWYHSNYQPGKELYVKYTFPAMEGTAVSKDPVAISSAEDMLKMRDNLAGSYYLTKDITVPENTQIFDDFSKGAAFTGTFDGKGHKIKGYTVNVTAAASEYPRVSLFGYTEDATFKNLTLSGVDIKVKADKGALVSALANGSAKCSKVTITGKISVSGNETAGTDGGDYEIYGFCQNGTFTNCTNEANITSSCRVKFYYESRATGIASFGTFENCKNAGTISVTGYMPSLESLYAAGISMSGTLTGCSNSGTIKAGGEADSINATGVCYEPDKISSCSNSGKVAVTNKTNNKSYAAGVAISVKLKDKEVCAKSFNTGTVSIKQQAGYFRCGGVFARVGGWLRECYNTGKVNVTASKNVGKNMGQVGGVAGDAGIMSECYNTGSISANVNCQIGGVAGISNSSENWTVIHCYNTGKVTAKKGCYYVGGVLGSYDNAKVNYIGKYFVYDNYSTTSQVYGSSMITWKPYRARGKKVSSITKKNCPRLSGKYWTYSGKHKRLILKNNKEK